MRGNACTTQTEIASHTIKQKHLFLFANKMTHESPQSPRRKQNHRLKPSLQSLPVKQSAPAERIRPCGNSCATSAPQRVNRPQIKTTSIAVPQQPPGKAGTNRCHSKLKHRFLSENPKLVPEDKAARRAARWEISSKMTPQLLSKKKKKN